MKAFALTVLAIAAGVAFVAPHSKPAPVGTPARETARCWFISPTERCRMALRWCSTAPATATSTPPRVNDSDYPMLVDTGATVVALTGRDAEAMGLRWNAEDLAPIVRGAGGPVMGVPIKIDAMTVGDFEARDVDAVIIPDGLSISLLGQSFLRHAQRADFRRCAHAVRLSVRRKIA